MGQNIENTDYLSRVAGLFCLPQQEQQASCDFQHSWWGTQFCLREGFKKKLGIFPILIMNKYLFVIHETSRAREIQFPAIWNISRKKSYNMERCHHNSCGRGCCWARMQCCCECCCCDFGWWGFSSCFYVGCSSRSLAQDNSNVLSSQQTLH